MPTGSSTGNKMFDKLEKQYQHVYSGTDYPECRLVEEALWASFSAYFRLRQGDEKQQDLSSFFYRNCIYLAASYKILRLGMVDPALNNMRTVFETIIWQYAYLIDDDIYSNFREINSLEKEKLEKNWSNTKERKLSNLRRKYNFQKMLKTIYTKEMYEKIFFGQYSMLSSKSHVSMFGANFNTPTMEGATTLEKDPEMIRRQLRSILYLISENLLCFMNCFNESVQPTVEKINKVIPPAISLAPNDKGLSYVISFKEV